METEIKNRKQGKAWPLAGDFKYDHQWLEYLIFLMLSNKWWCYIFINRDYKRESDIEKRIMNLPPHPTW